MEQNTPETTTLSVREQRSIELLGDQILAIRMNDGLIYLPVRALCDGLGLDRPAQVRRIKRDETLSEDLQEVTVETEGGPQVIQVLRLESVPFWLSGVTASKVRPELREKLLAYKRWVVRKVYEAFINELGIDDQTRADEAQTTLEGSTSATLMALAQVREMGRAIMQMAEAQMDLERRQTTSENRLKRAAVVVADIQRRLTKVERRLDPQNVVTDEQAAAISSHVKALAMLLTSHDPGKNHFGGIFGELYRRCRVTDYKSIRQDQFDDVIQFLDEWRERVLNSEAE